MEVLTFLVRNDQAGLYDSCLQLKRLLGTTENKRSKKSVTEELLSWEGGARRCFI